jgi:3',5'-cyclic AMP phosphodiesterase CpdA
MRNLLLCLGLVFLVGCTTTSAPPEHTINFIVASDMGRRGVSEQQNIAALMARQIETSNIDFVAVAGDPIHDMGVASVDDEEWKLKFENVYTDEALQKTPFYVVSGNHEYNGNVQAILDYSQKSERWNAPARYFSVERPIGTDEQKALFVFIDTTPLIDRYREEGYSDAKEQDWKRQLYWLDSTLFTSTCHWVFVIGHHPIYCDTEKGISERTDMQERVGQILEKRKADFYISGHIHNFQYIRPEGKSVHYIVNSSASQSRDVKPYEDTVFCNPDPGYSVFTVSAESVIFFFVNHTGETVYRKTVMKE